MIQFGLTKSILRVLSNVLIENQDKINRNKFKLFVNKGVKGYLINYEPESILFVIPKEQLMDLSNSLFNKLPEKLYFTVTE